MDDGNQERQGRLQIADIIDTHTLPAPDTVPLSTAPRAAAALATATAHAVPVQLPMASPVWSPNEAQATQPTRSSKSMASSSHDANLKTSQPLSRPGQRPAFEQPLNRKPPVRFTGID